ncbi:MAG: DNA alkylation repair protein [Anaerolineales bacterium]|nr:DNA alkylation repair protein [Anaerolineales bacterium]
MTKRIEELLESLPKRPEEDSLLKFLDAAFNHLGDKDYREMIQTAVPGMEEGSYGVRVPELRTLTKKLVNAYKDQFEILRSLIEPIWSQPTREHKQVALFISFYGKIPADEGWELALRLIPDIQNWEVCDQLCLSLTTPALAQDPRLFDTLEEWVGSASYWRRRVALVTAAILRKPIFPAKEAAALDQRVLQMCLGLLDDPEPYVAKAVDWTIREILKRRYDMARVWMFTRLQEDLSRTARSTLRKASAKLTDTDRRYFLEQFKLIR